MEPDSHGKERNCTNTEVKREGKIKPCAVEFELELSMKTHCFRSTFQQTDWDTQIYACVYVCAGVCTGNVFSCSLETAVKWERLEAMTAL